MFNELKFEKFNDGIANGYWTEEHNIIINTDNMAKSYKVRSLPFTPRERSVEEMAKNISKIFLIEFICMELSNGDQNNPKCDKALYLNCTPRTTAKEMLRSEGKARKCNYCNIKLTNLEYKTGSCVCEDY